ncbi:unnamed protein product, partial [Linum tenue]
PINRPYRVLQEEPGLRSKSRKLQSSFVETAKFEYNLLPQGQTGDDSITLIPFQVLLSIHFIFLPASFCDSGLCSLGDVKLWDFC